MENDTWARVDMEFLFECLTLKMKACVESLQKQTMGLVFNVQNSQFFVLVLTDRRNLSGTRPKSGCTKSQVVDFRSQPQDMPLPKQLNE